MKKEKNLMLLPVGSWIKTPNGSYDRIKFFKEEDNDAPKVYLFSGGFQYVENVEEWIPEISEVCAFYNEDGGIITIAPFKITTKSGHLTSRGKVYQNVCPNTMDLALCYGCEITEEDEIHYFIKVSG